MLRVCALGLALVALAGCAAGPVGTWTGRGGRGDAPFSFGSVSFVGDQTFTAEARYEGTVRVQSGTWSTSGDRLYLTSGDTKREYAYRVEDGTLVVTDPESGQSITLDRLER